MTKAELRNIAEDLVEELREMPDGKEITSVELLEIGRYDLEKLCRKLKANTSKA